MKRILLTALIVCLMATVVFAGGFDGNALFFVDADGRIRINFNPSGNVTWTWPTADGTASQYLQTDGSGTLSFASGGATAWDDLSAPDANKTLAFTTYTNLFTGTSTAADQWTFRGTGNFGDVSVVKIESLTGNPTDGTVLEVVSHDANTDPLVVSSSANASAFVVGQDGNTSVGGNLSITGTWTIDAVAASTGGSTLTLDGNGAGGVNIGSTSTGGVTIGATSTVADGKDVTIGEGVLTVDNDQAAETAVVITSDATTAGGGISLTSAVTTTNGKSIKVVADDVTTGDLLYLESSAAGMTTGNFINAYNGATTVFEVGLYGATTMAGNAATDIVIVTAGNIQMTNGDIDVDEGKLEIDTTANESSYIKRNQATTTTPIVEIEETNASGDNPALLIDQNATAAGSYGIEVDTAGGTAAYLNLEAAAGNGIVFATPASYTGSLISVNDTLIGANGTGIIDIKTTANMATGSTLVRLDADTGTLAGATDGFLLSLDDDSVGVATSYALKIDSANNESLHVATGKALFDEQATFTLGIDSDAGLDVDLAANTNLVNITHAATDLTAGDGVLTVYGSGAAGQTNASYLIRGAWKANGDAQDGFILFEDNSTGAAGNGDDMFKVDSGGAVTQTGNLTSSTGTSQIIGFISAVADSGAGPDSPAITACGGTYYSSQANQTNLPEASTAIGCTFTFVVGNASNYDINPDNADQIIGATDAAGDMIRSGTVGDTVTLRAISASQWAVISMYPASTDWADAN